MKTAPVFAVVDGDLPETALPDRIACMVVYGAAVSEGGSIVSVELKVGSATVVESFQGFPRPDRVSAFPNADRGQRLFSGFAIAWSGPLSVGFVQVSLRFVVDDVELAERHSRWFDLGRIRVSRPRIRVRSGQAAQVAIAMATFNPPPKLFAAQLESIRSQTHNDWALVVSDESTNQASRSAIAECVGEDPRITLLHDRRIGVVGNFQRSLTALDSRSPFFALSDQDDVWEPQKLEVLVRAARRSNASLVYGGMRIVAEDGTVIDPSFFAWRRRHGDSTHEILMANTVTGAASLGRMELLRAALPIPQFPGIFHDMWLALVASQLSGVHYVNSIVQDYVQHRTNVIGQNSQEDEHAATCFAKHTQAVATIFPISDFDENQAARIDFAAAGKLVPILSAVWPAAIEREFLSGVLTSRIEDRIIEIGLAMHELTAGVERRSSIARADDPHTFLNIPKWLETGTIALARIADDPRLARRIAQSAERETRLAMDLGDTPSHLDEKGLRAFNAE